METAYSNLNSIDIALWIWFALTAVSVAFVAWDLLTRTPEIKKRNKNYDLQEMR